MKKVIIIISISFLIIISYIIDINALSKEKVLSFTFDDGPSIYSKEIADLLYSYNYDATFFFIGNKMKDNADIVKYLINKNMEIGSHSYSHNNFNYLTKDEILSEINSSQIIYREITGENIKLTRFPYGINNMYYVNTPIINWNVDTKDWYYLDSEYLYNYLLKNINKGDIVLMHESKETLEALKKALPVLKRKGYVITDVTSLASINNETLENGKIYYSFN